MATSDYVVDYSCGQCIVDYNNGPCNRLYIKTGHVIDYVFCRL